MQFDLPLEQLKEYKGVSPKPADFDAFWDKALSEIPENGADYVLEKSDLKVPGLSCYHLYFHAEDGSIIHCRFARPENIHAPAPALLRFHGYAGANQGFHELITYALMGFNVLYMDCRGQGGRSEDLGEVKGTTYKGLIIRGLEEGPDKLYYKRVYLDTVRCARILMSMDGVDKNRVGVMGGSQGGALSLACAALEPRIRFVCASAPFLCDFKRVIELGLMQDAYEELGWHFRVRDPRHENEESFLNTLSYIDIANLAPRIKADVYWKVGLCDTVCPPSTQFAAYNRIKSKKSILIYPEFAHEVSSRFDDEDYEFILKY